MSNTIGHVLVVDNDVQLLSLCHQTARQAGVVAHTVASAQQAHDLARSRRFDLALISAALPHDEVRPLVELLRHDNPTLPVVVVADRAPDEPPPRTFPFPIQRLLVKPLSVSEIGQIFVSQLAPRPLMDRRPSPIHTHRRFLSELNPRRLYDAIVETVRVELEADHVALFLWDSAGETLAFTALAGQPLHVQVGRQGVSAEQMAYQVGVNGEPVRLGPESDQVPGGDEPLLSVPLVAGDRVVGVLQATRSGLDRPFSEEDQELLQLLTGQVTVAIENARLYSLAQQRTERLDTLYRISTAVAGSLDLEVITATTLQQIGAVLPLDQAQLLLVHAAPLGPPLRRSWRTTHLSPLEKTRLPRQGSLMARVLADGTPRVEPHQPVGIKGVDGANGQEALCVVLRSEQQTCGAVELVSQPGYRFSDEDIQFIVALGVPLALAIEKARLHADIAASEARNRALLEYANDAVLLLDAKGRRIIDANRSLEQLTGYSRSALQALAPEHLFGDSWRGHYEAATNQGEGPHPPFEALLHTSGQTSVPVSVGVSRVPYGGDEIVLLIVRDISDRQRTAQQVVQAEKLAAIGRLASSIAHEVNNPLQAIYNSLNLLRKDHMGEEKRRRYLDMTFAEAERLIGIVQRLIDFHRPSREGMRPTQMLDLIEGLLAHMDEQIQQRNVLVVRDWQAPQPRVMGVRGHLKQVCTNLILNALDAMSEGGTLTIRVYQEREEQGRGTGRQRAQESLLVVEFRDTGRGIPPHDLHKIFEPFYTTKVTGTGLGLAISYNIVQQHGGDLTAISEPGGGTTFRLRLPVVE